MYDHNSLFRVEVIENGFLVAYKDLMKVAQRPVAGLPPGFHGELPREDPQPVVTVVEKTKFCKDADEVASVAKSICAQAPKIKAYLDERGGMPGAYTALG